MSNVYFTRRTILLNWFVFCDILTISLSKALLEDLDLDLCYSANLLGCVGIIKKVKTIQKKATDP